MDWIGSANLGPTSGSKPEFLDSFKARAEPNNNCVSKFQVTAGMRSPKTLDHLGTQA